MNIAPIIPTPKDRFNILSASRVLSSDFAKAQFGSMYFGYIAPIEYLDLVPRTARFHLCLAHLCPDQRYSAFYRGRREQGDMIIMDNSAFELGEGIETSQLLDLIDASEIEPDVIVAPDYPGQDPLKTLRALEQFREAVRDRYAPRRVGVMGVPQGEIARPDQWVMCYNEMIAQYVDVVGISILALPNAFCGITGTKDISHNRLYGSMYLKRQGHYDSNTWHHYLGAGSPSELQLIAQSGLGDSMDSSSPIWHGINAIRYDDSPTALINGKIKRHVDFHLERAQDMSQIQSDVEHNIAYIESAIRSAARSSL